MGWTSKHRGSIPCTFLFSTASMTISVPTNVLFNANRLQFPRGGTAKTWHCPHTFILCGHTQKWNCTSRTHTSTWRCTTYFVNAPGRILLHTVLWCGLLVHFATTVWAFLHIPAHEAPSAAAYLHHFLGAVHLVFFLGGGLTKTNVQNVKPT
jgi:hypothetical protein